MKHLNIKWAPETFAIASLTIVTAGVPSPQHEVSASDSPVVIASLARTKVIVISGHHELRAAVTTTAQAFATV